MSYAHKKQGLFLSRLFGVVLLSFFIFLGGCNGYGTKAYVRPGVDKPAIKRIAVLPFESLMNDEYSGERIRRLVITELLSRGVEVIEPGEVRRLLIEEKVKSLGAISRNNLKNLGTKLGVDAIMMGSVETYKISSGLAVTYPEVSINLRLVDPPSGNIIWSAGNTSGGASFLTRHFGSEGITLSDAARKVVKEAINTLY